MEHIMCHHYHFYKNQNLINVAGNKQKMENSLTLRSGSAKESNEKSYSIKTVKS